MLKNLKNRKKNNKGFSLVELIIVVAILAILTGILAPQYIRWVEKSRVAKDEANAAELLLTVQTALADDTDNEIAANATATFSDAGIASGDTALQAYIASIYNANDLTKAPESKTYQGRTYTVTVAAAANNGGLTASGAWSAVTP